MIQVSIDTEGVRRMVGAIHGRHIRFATVRALTLAARDVQASTRASMPSKFTLRRQWVVKGIRMEAATMSTLESKVFSIDPFMGRQEVGGTKTGKPGGGDFSSASVPQTGGKRVRPAQGRVAVPTDKVLRSKSAIIRKSDLPARLGSKAFVIQKGNTGLLVRRFAKGKRAGLQTLYVLKQQTQVKPRLGLKEIAQKVVSRRFGAIFNKTMTEAIATAKPRP